MSRAPQVEDMEMGAKLLLSARCCCVLLCATILLNFYTSWLSELLNSSVSAALLRQINDNENSFET